MAADHATIAEEEYLQIMFWLEEAGLPITGANVARAMQLSPPTVHEMIGRLETDGYIAPPGRQVGGVHRRTGASRRGQIVRRHRLIERFLTDVLGIPWDEVHEEAERLEHAMSPVLEERMLAAIGDAKTCPHGHPIVEGAREHGVLLADVEPGAEVHVLRFENEAEEILHYLKGTGIYPGLDGKLEARDESEVVVSSEGGRHVGLPRRGRDRVGAGRPGAAARAPLPEQLRRSATATAADAATAASGAASRRLAADLAQPPVEAGVLRTHRLPARAGAPTPRARGRRPRARRSAARPGSAR